MTRSLKYIGEDPAVLDNFVRAVASGTLADGSKVVANSNGTVSAVAASNTSISQLIGTPVVYSSSNGNTFNCAAFDSNANKTVIAWRNVGSSNYGTAVVATVDPSDNSISYGTPVVWNSNTTQWIDIAFDSSVNKVVIAYDHAQSTGRTIVGTVSGTGISFDDATTFESGRVQYVQCAFDSNSNKVVIAYSDQGDSDKGKAVVGTVSVPANTVTFGTIVTFRAAANYIAISFDSNVNKMVLVYRASSGSTGFKALVGTVSGTNISFGSEAAVSGNNAYNNACTFDSNSNKTVVFFADGGASNRGTARVGTISGTNISFGTAVVYETGNLGDGEGDMQDASFDSNVNKVIAAYRNESSSNRGTFAVGTVSGTNISFSSSSVFDTTATDYFGSVFDSNINRVVIVYRDTTDSNKGTGTVVTVAGTKTTFNITAENYIGISDAAYADGSPALIQTKGAVDDAQSSLTAGLPYFVQPDGTLGTSAGDPSVFAGTALASTKLIVKG